MTCETAPDRLPEARTHVPAHRPRLDEFHRRGVLLMAGPCTDPTAGALGAFTTREVAAEFIAGDPFVLAGLVARWTIRESNEVRA